MKVMGGSVYPLKSNDVLLYIVYLSENALYCCCQSTPITPLMDEWGWCMEDDEGKPSVK